MAEWEKAPIVGGKQAKQPAWMSGTVVEPEGVMDKLGRQAGLTARSAVAGAASLPAMGADAIGYILNLGIKAYNAQTGSKIPEFQPQMETLEQNLSAAGLPSPETGTERIVSEVNKAVSGQGAFVAGGRALAGAVKPVVSKVGEVLAARPGLQVATGAAGTGAGGVTREEGGGPGAQLAANLAATVAVPTIAGMVTRKPLSPEIQAVIAESKRRDVPLSYADITGGGGARRLDTMLEQAPVVGTSKFRETGAKKATEAMESFAKEAKGAMQGTQYRGLDKLKAAAAAGDKPAKNTLDQIQNAGEDWTKIMQSSGNLKLWRARQDANVLYGRVEAIANTRGQVPLSRSNAALDSAIAEESASKLPDKALIDKLTEIKTNIASGNDFSAVRQLRSDIGDLVENYYKGANAAVGAKGVGRMQAVKNAVEGDMESFATTNGGDLQRAWKRADEFYKAAIVPYKDKALASALKSDLPDEVYRKFIQVSRSGAGEDRAQKFYNALDPKGRSAVRYGMIANAIDSATIPEKQRLLSPGKFEQSLENIEKASGVFFKGDDRSELNGFKNLMEHARRFGQYQENPPTGQRVIPWLALGGAALSFKATSGVAGAALGAKLLITTEGGKRFLLEASALKAGTPSMQALVDRISQQIPRLSGLETSRQEEKTQAQRTPTSTGTNPPNR